VNLEERISLLSLVAQQDAALAAIISAVAGVLSAVFLVWTLVETRKTAKAAFDSAEISRKSLTLAAENFAYAKMLADQDLAPYPVIKEAKIGIDPDGVPGITIVYANFGRSPAFNIKCSYGVGVASPPLAQPKLETEGSEFPIMAPGQEFAEHLIFHKAGNKELDAINGGAIIVVVFALEWQNVKQERQCSVQTMVADERCVRTTSLRMPNDMEILPA